MTSPEPWFERYRTGDDTEWIMIFGNRNDSQLLVIESLFEERNFLRRFTVSLARVLATKGFAVSLCDLPGTGDSLQLSHDLSLWSRAIADAALHIFHESGRLPHLVSLRGGALIDHEASALSRWRFAPADGPSILRPLYRALKFSDGENVAALGLAEPMGHALETASIPEPDSPCRNVAMPPGVTPLWRLSEPGENPGLAAELAEDIVDWVQKCAIR